MSPDQKAIFQQLQLTGLGVVLLVFGVLSNHMEISIIGGVVALYGIARAIFIKKILDQSKEE